MSQLAHRQSLQITQLPGQTCRFFKLSAELRNLVYELLEMKHDDAPWITADSHSHLEREVRPFATPPPIAQVCQLLRAETLSIYYGINGFSICLMRERNVARARRWIATVGDTGVSRLRTLRLHGYAWAGSWHSTIYLSLTVSLARNGCLQIRHDDDGEAIRIVADAFARDTQGHNYPLARIVRTVKEASMASSGDNRDTVTAASLELMVETFASFCTFRNERPQSAWPSQQLKPGIFGRISEI